jgi:hypothetical protein
MRQKGVRFLKEFSVNQKNEKLLQTHHVKLPGDLDLELQWRLHPAVRKECGSWN